MLRRLLPLAVLAFALAGCGLDSAAGDDAQARFSMQEPDFSSEAMFSLRFSTGNRVALGDIRNHAETEAGHQENQPVVTELPAPLRGSDLNVRSWQGAFGGVGLVLYNERVTAMLETYEGKSISASRFENELKYYTDSISRMKETGGSDPVPTVVKGRFVEYRFWETNRQRLMLCLYTPPDGKVKITVAAGFREIMDALRMSPLSARDDQAKTDEMLAPLEGKSLPSSPAPSPSPGDLTTPNPGMQGS